jgi:hypothetical protein
MEDWAFTNGGIAYNIGKPGRVQNQIIRVRLTANMTFRAMINPSAGYLDVILSKLKYSQQEVNYDELLSCIQSCWLLL